MQEKLKLKDIYDKRMKKNEHLVATSLTNENMTKVQQKSIDEIFQVLRSGDHNGNPLGSTMGRNYNYFYKLRVKKRIRIQKELSRRRAISEAQNLNTITVDQASS